MINHASIAVPPSLDRLSDTADYAVIGPTDGRARVHDALQPPFSSICHVQRDFGDGRLRGCSGFLASPSVVLTAGHCVYSRSRLLRHQNSVPVRVKITPARNGFAQSKPFGGQWATRWYAHEQFVRSGHSAFDYGVIILKRPFAHLTVGFKLYAAARKRLMRMGQTRMIHIAGYPSDKVTGQMWWHSERLGHVGCRKLYYSVDTCPGHSGAPIWVQTAEYKRPVVIGIHTAGPKVHHRGVWGCMPGVPIAPTGAANSGVRITHKLLDNVKGAAAVSKVLSEMLCLQPDRL